MQLNKWIESFVPENSEYTEWDYRRRKLFVSVSFVSAAYAFAYFPVVIITGYPAALPVIFGFTILNSLFPILLRYKVSYNLLAYFYATTFVAAETIILTQGGGIICTDTDPQIMVIPVIMVLLFLGLRPALFYLGLVIVILSTFAYLEMNGYDFPYQMDPSSIELQNAMAVIGHPILMFLVINVFENLKNEALNNLKEKNLIIEEEKKRSDDLLLNILPAEIAEELKNSGRSKTKTYSMVTVMFIDFKDFTSVSEKVSGELLVEEIDHCFSAFDNILQKYKIEKIKTIGDAYITASGLPALSHTHAVDTVSTAIEILDFMLARKKEKEKSGEIPFEIRIGIHTGPVVAGIVGVKKFAYDIWGDAVNTAARMESSGEAGKINISGATYELVKNKFNCIHRGKITAKNKGEIDMYFVEQ